jgi:hypothetical protein
MIPQSTPLYGYAWSDTFEENQAPDSIAVIGWEPEDEGDGFTTYRPIVAWLNSTGGGSAFALSDDWNWYLTTDRLDEHEGLRIKARYTRETAAIRAAFPAR